ncbi:MFS transporter [Micromonospora phytophila]|uniref:MFS transporter n=1 Tax=Micromonospora phytophila TaxID=709888 RepID=UPI00202ECD50|nr:MFS transporter [Micromonospora phytophila]MCM0673463.1 MFS transporter [Micromonospora phytophila]
MRTGFDFGPLRDRRYRLFWLGRSASGFGDALMPMTQVFAILSVGGSATDVGVVLAVSMAVRVLLLLVGGALADRLPRRLLLIGADASLAALQVLVGCLLLTGHGTVPLILAASVCYGAGSAISRPAITGIVPQMIGRTQLQQANALLGLSRGVASILGPAAAGVIAAVTGPGPAYLIDAVTYLVSALCLAVLTIPPHDSGARASLVQDLSVGWQEMTARPWYWRTLCCHALWNLGSSVLPVLGPVVLLDAGHTSSSWGIVAAGMAAGSVVGGLVVLRWRPQRPMVVGHIGLALTALPLLALTGPSMLGVLVGGAVLGAAGVSLLNELWMTGLQQLVPQQVISRLSSYDGLISLVVLPIGYVSAGPLANLAGTSMTLGIGALLVVASTVLALRIPQIRLLRQEPDGTLVGPGLGPASLDGAGGYRPPS